MIHWVQTYTGRGLDFDDIQQRDISIRDIARHLSMQCRYNGATRHFYSVAQHSILVSRIVPKSDARWGLMHDAAEAYMGDLAFPIKEYLKSKNNYEFSRLEKVVLGAIATRFGLDGDIPESVRYADKVLTATERRDLMAIPPRDWEPLPAPHPDTIEPMSQRAAEAEFIHRAYILGIK